MRAAKKASRLTWFATNSGRKFSLGCVVAFGGGAALFNFLPHTLLLDKYRELFQLYRKSTPVRVSAKIKKEFNTVLDDLEVPNQIRYRLKPFAVIGFDIFHAGTTHLASGALVGVPWNFNYEEVKDIDQAALLVQGKPVDWSEPDGQNLLASITLSENARKFALGREIIRCQTIEPLLNTFYPASCTLFAYLIGCIANSQLNGLARSFSFRMIPYALTGLFSLGYWAFCKDFTTVYYDTKCDKAMSQLGKDYVRGGQEFYSKILQRNVALRNLMGTEGPELYSVSGNEEFFLRHKRVPIVHRKLYFDKLMEESVN